MDALSRYITEQVQHDMARKMVFIPGPRQVGKTTLARNLAKSPQNHLNRDVAEHRERILKGEMPATRLWILDEGLYNVRRHAAGAFA